MGKRNKFKTPVRQVKPAVVPAVQKPSDDSIVVRVSNEARAEEIEKSIQAVKDYCDSKKKEADDALSIAEQEREAARVEKDKAKEEGAREAEEEKQKILDKAKEEADRIRESANSLLDDAQSNADKIKNDALEKARSDFEEEKKSLINDLNERSGKLTQECKDLARSRDLMVTEVEKDFRDEINHYRESLGRLESELSNLKEECRKKEIEVKAKDAELSAFQEAYGPLKTANSQSLLWKNKCDIIQSDNDELVRDLEEARRTIADQREIIRGYGEDPEGMIKEIGHLNEEVERLQGRLNSCPSESEISELRNIRMQYEKLLEEHEELNSKYLSVQDELRMLKLSRDDLDMSKRFIKALELQKEELQREVDRNIKLYNNRAEKVFPTLSKIDAEPVGKAYKPYNVDLKQFCADFQSYLNCRPEKPLYYDITTIRTFVAGFASSRLMILEGLSGTGKSSLPLAFMDFMGAETSIVPVQSSWKDRNDLLGFYNDFKKQYKETEFLNALYRAVRDPSRVYLIVLDEMNISRIEYYFADFLSVLQNPDDMRILDLVSDSAGVTSTLESWPEYIQDGKLAITNNIWFIGTANKDDSTMTITDKVYDRAVVIEFEDKGSRRSDLSYAKPVKVNIDDFTSALRGAKWAKGDRQSYGALIAELSAKVKELFHINFGNRIEQQLETFIPAYVACGGTVGEAVDIMFARKILRKLEGFYDEDTKERLGKLSILAKNKGMRVTSDVISRMMREI